MTSLAMPCQVTTADSRSDAAYEELLGFTDLVIRTVRNALMTPLYRLFYISTINLYPGILTGQKTAIQPWKIRESVGWAAKDSATVFLKDMDTIGAWRYDPGKYNPKEEERVGYITANVDVLPFPETFDLKTLDKQRRAKKAEEKKAKQFKNPLQLFQCQECGSNDLVYDATARCTKCGHVHDPIKDIPASMITIEAELIEIADDADIWDAPTIQVAAVRPQVQQLPITPIPAVLTPVLENPDKFCRQCGRPRRDCFVLTASGLWDMSCC